MRLRADVRDLITLGGGRRVITEAGEWFAIVDVKQVGNAFPHPRKKGGSTVCRAASPYCLLDVLQRCRSDRDPG